MRFFKNEQIKALNNTREKREHSMTGHPTSTAQEDKEVDTNKFLKRLIIRIFSLTHFSVRYTLEKMKINKEEKLFYWLLLKIEIYKL